MKKGCTALIFLMLLLVIPMAFADELNLSFSISGSVYSSDVLLENGTNVIITAASAGLENITLYVNGTEINSGTVSISNTTSFDANWASPINITAIYNLTNSLTRFITIESTSSAPRVTLSSPSNNAFTNSLNVPFRINSVDAVLKNATLQIFNLTNALIYSNTTEISGMSNETIWTYNLSDGNYSWNALVYDNSNNFNLSSNYSLIVDLTNPTVSSSLSSSNIYEDESSTISCSGSDLNFYYIKILVYGSQRNISSSSALTSLTYIQSGSIGTGTYTISCNIADKAGNSNSESRLLTVSSRQTTTPSGGGASQPINQTNTTVTTNTETKTTFTNVSANKVIEFAIPTQIASEGITAIAIVPSINSSNVSMNLKVITPGNITDFASKAAENVYGYFNITVNLNESSIKNATINFDVSKKWLNSTNLSKEDVKLKRYKNGSWQDLERTILSEDSVKVSYQAKSPGFSLFAITAEKAVSPTSEEVVSGETAKKSKLWLWIALIGSTVLLVGFIIFVIKRNKASSYP